MNRRGNREFLLDLFKKIKDKVPNAVLRTTYIVGFPGETDDDFAELVQFTKQFCFDHMGAFKYSREDHTKADTYENQVDVKLKVARLHHIMDVQKKISYKKNKEHRLFHGLCH